MTISSMRIPTAIRFGVGAIDLVPSLLKNAGVHRPLLVTDKALADLDVFRGLVTLCQRNGLTTSTYSESEGNPVLPHVSNGVSAYRAHHADGIVIMGGGCALDVGKAIALMVNHPGHLFDYEDGKIDARPMNQEFPFVLAIPTTAGTGSEVGGSSVISDLQTHRKYIVWGTQMVPPMVVADPALTFGLPAKVTAATGIDALTHNVEAYLATGFHPVCEAIALEGMRLVFENLVTAVKNPTDVTARSNMLMASMMGAIAFQKGLGVTHSCAHSLSTCFDLHHGLANGMMLSACLAFNAEKVPEKFATMAKRLDFSGSQGSLVEKFLVAIRQLCIDVGLPRSLKELKVSLTDQLLDVALADPCHTSNPRPVSRADFRALYTRALEG